MQFKMLSIERKK